MTRIRNFNPAFLTRILPNLAVVMFCGVALAGPDPECSPSNPCPCNAVCTDGQCGPVDCPDGTCTIGACVVPTGCVDLPRDCDDQDPCTIDSCDSQTGCVNELDDVDPTSTAALNNNAATDSGGDFEPQITTDGSGAWLAVWYSDDDLGGTIGTDTDILYAKSTDNGATWTAPSALNNNASVDSGLDNNPQLVTDGSGTWIATWYSNNDLGGTIGTDFDIIYARSTNNGATWTSPAALNSNANSDSGTDVVPSLESDGTGNLVAVWMSNDTLGGTIGTDIDILVSRSTNSGATWTTPAALNSNAATDNATDSDPEVTSDGSGNWIAVWTSNDTLGGTIGSDFDILVARSTDNGATWTSQAALNSNANTDTGTDDKPQVTPDGSGNWIAVWASDDTLGGTIGTDSDVLIARSTNIGTSWTSPAVLNNNASIDSGKDFQPQLTTDGSCNWVVVWFSKDDLGGTIGMDNDILVVHSIDNGITWTDPIPLHDSAATDNSLTTADRDPELATDRSGNWIAVWSSEATLSGIGADCDILTTRFNLVGP